MCRAVCAALVDPEYCSHGNDYGFGLPPLEKAPLYQRAFEIAMLELDEPEDFSFLLNSSSDLVMIDSFF